MSNDAELLRSYLQCRDEGAFTELVRRHVDVVYAAALRRANGRAHLAEEITQRVFCDLARKAAPLVDHPVLIGWLHRSTRYAAIDALRGEMRREKLGRELTAMTDPTPDSEPAVPWEQLRPVLDAALDELPARDRELVLLRHFSGLTFADAGARLGLREDAARRRTERALDKLRGVLARRGVTSTTAALGVLLANQPLVAAPAGVAASVSAAALAAAPAGAVASAVTFFLMNKVAASALSALVAVGLTTVVWTSVARDRDPELESLRAENAKLTRATAAGAPASETAAVASEYATTATAIARAMEQRQASRTGAAAGSAAKSVAAAAGEVTARGHRNHGIATPLDAALTFAWAGDVCDPDEFAKIVCFDPKAREAAQAVLAGMPEEVRAQYPTPEKLFGMLLAASCLEAPPPTAEMMERFMTVVEIAPGRAASRRVGSDRNTHEYQLTESGWKYVLPEAGVRGLPGILNSETLARLNKTPATSP
ncbi:MAG: sigma-70 family RNA polymerase sigma factor [Opitutae bacterium]|nr:sigma-70 family RNA polymerase sigma factor [Opitutae bacterium]